MNSNNYKPSSQYLRSLLFTIDKVGRWSGFEQEVTYELNLLLANRLRDKYGLKWQLDDGLIEITDLTDSPQLPEKAQAVYRSIDMSWEKICCNPELYFSSTLLKKILTSMGAMN